MKKGAEQGFLREAVSNYKQHLFKKYFLAIASVFLLFFLLIFSSGSVLANGLPYAWWHLNEASGTNVSDSSGNNRTGTTVNSPSWVAGKLNNSIQFVSTNQYLKFGNIAGFERTDNISIELWIKTADTEKYLFAKRDALSSYRGYYASIISGKLQFGLVNTIFSNELIVNGSITLNNNVWHYVVITYAGTSTPTGIKVYVDNVLDNTSVVSNTLTSSIVNVAEFNIGTRTNQASGCLLGYIDEFALYNRILSPTEINFRWNGGIGTEAMYVSCTPNWIVNYTSCGINLNVSCGTYDNKTKIYYDTNSCGSTLNLPADNGTCVACNYCDSSWSEIPSNCTPIDKKFKIYNDTNNCCHTTHLPSDCNTVPVDNGTFVDCNYCIPSWYCGKFNLPCPNQYANDNLICLLVNSSNYATCCAVTNLTSDCNFTGNLSLYDKKCGFRYFNLNMSFFMPMWDYIQPVLTVPQYPYVDCNTSYPISVSLYLNGSKINITRLWINFTNEPVGNQTFNFTWNAITKDYEATFIFPAEDRDFPFVISGQDPNQIIYNTTGTFLVRCPFYVTIEGYKEKNTSAYVNKFAVVTAEFPEERNKMIVKGVKGYNDALENFIVPLTFRTQFQTPVFHASYIGGKAVLKLYEKDRNYGIRLFDGIIDFKQGVYSPPNMTKGYGVNMFLGTLYLNGSDTTYQYYLEDKDIHQYRWLFNWIVILALIIVMVVSFVLMMYVPQIAMPFGIGFTFMILVLRILAWFLLGQ